MSGIIRFFVERHLMVNVLALTTIVLAFYFASSVPREYMPSVKTPRATIAAKLPGASARDMETKVTIPIEEAIETVDGVDEFSTTISDSVSITSVDLYIDSTDEQVETALQDLRDAINGITDFPAEMEDEPTITQFNPGKYSIIEVALAGPMDTLVPLAKKLERRMQRLPDISRATIVGLQDPEVRILVDPNRANALGITVLDVVRAVERRNVSSTGAVLETPTNRKQVVVWSRFDHPEDVADTIITGQSSSGRVVRISDVARIESHREDTGLITHTNAEPGLSLVVRKRENSDALDAVAQVRDLMANTKIPPEVTFSYVNDTTFYTRNRLSVMATNGMLGGILVAIILFVFMRKEAALWVVIGIPIVFCGALMLLPFLGMTFNLFTLTGLVIVLGMVVDDAVVVSENIIANREHGLGPVEAAVKGAHEMIRPVFAAAITTILAFGPIVAMGGLPGRIMWQIPAMVVLVLIFSLLESFLVLPAHMSGIKDKGGSAKRPFVLAMEHYYRQALSFSLRHRAIVLGIAITAFLLVMVVVRANVNFVQFPQADARMLFVKVTTPLGTPLEQTEAVATNLQTQIAKLCAADLRAVTARIGHQDVNGNEKERGEAENEALLNIVYKELDRDYNNAEWIQILNRELDVPQNVTLTFQSEYIGPPTDQPVTLHVLSNDDELRRAIANDIENYVRASQGTTEIQIDERAGTPKLDLNLNYEKLALLGLDPQTVALTVQASFFGLEASEHRDMEDTTELRVQFDPAARGDLNAFLDTPIRTSSGALVRLRDVANPIETPGLDRIYHREGTRATTVRASFTPQAPYTSISYAGKIQADLLPRYAELDNVEVLIGGEAKDTAEATGELGKVALLVVLAIGVVIWILLGSLMEALFVLVVIPFALAGVILAFFIHDLDLSMTAIIGTIGLAGVVVNASIVMLDAIHRHMDQERGTRPPLEIMQDAVVSRLRPIVVTTLTTLGGVLPTAYGIGGYDTIVSPMSIAIGWGLMFSTLVTLFVVPVLFSIAQDINYRFNRGNPQDHFEAEDLQQPNLAG